MGGRFTCSYNAVERAALTEYLSDATNWGISWDALLSIEHDARQAFGRDFPSKNMRDVVETIVRPLCARQGAPIALVRNGWRIAPATCYVVHAWEQPFSEFMKALHRAFKRSHRRKPVLFISAFVQFQSDDPYDVDLKGLGSDLLNAPFVKVLRAVDQCVLVRTATVDIFSRAWIVIELLYAQRFGLYPARCIITGPPHASDNMGSPLDVEATFAEEKITILRAILDECSVDHVAERIHEFRIFASRSGSAQSP